MTADFSEYYETKLGHVDKAQLPQDEFFKVLVYGAEPWLPACIQLEKL